MEFLHKELKLSTGDVVEVTLDHAANVQILDPANFELYRKKKPYRYHGGHAKETPVRISAPSAGRWFLVIDLGGAPGTVRAGVSVLSSQSA
jgi:hypothetical protein